VEYVEQDEYLLTGKNYDEFKNVFQYFAAPKAATGKKDEDNEDEKEENEDDKKPEDKPLSRKKKKELKRLRVAQLKALVRRPDLVEVINIFINNLF
jgi:hypothetical protein